jgi:histidinol-phosphate phosphatase family domain/HAD-superfamily hydrolase, subfamily IIIA
MKAVIMAGGKGTRIASLNSQTPKPMIHILNQPILEYQIERLREQGIRDITLVIGHLGHVIQNYFADGEGVSPATGKPFGVHISYFVETESLGTAGALYHLKNQLHDVFLLLNGDIVFDIDINRFYRFHRDSGALATIFTHPNNHPEDSGILVTKNDGCVESWLHKENERAFYHNRVNAGLHIISPEVLGCLSEPKKADLDRDVLEPLIRTGRLYAYDSPEYVKDVGTPDRLASAAADLKAGRVRSRNLSNKQRAVFLDRDGTINQYVGFLKNIEDFKLLDGAAAAIRLINESGYLAIVVTNQPVIARGEVTQEQLQQIHNKMETLLGQQGAFLDAIYYCPHHPQKGYAGERTEYKIECSCRKPKPGMLYEAAEKYNIDLSQSWVVGDGLIDVQTGLNAGCKVAYIGTEVVENARSYPSLLECVKQILDT